MNRYEGLAIARQLGDIVGSARATRTLSTIARWQDDLDASASLGHQSLEQHQVLNQRHFHADLFAFQILDGVDARLGDDLVVAVGVIGEEDAGGFATAFAGDNRYETAALAAVRFFPTPGTIGAASGKK